MLLLLVSDRAVGGWRLVDCIHHYLYSGLVTVCGKPKIWNLNFSSLMMLLGFFDVL